MSLNLKYRTMPILVKAPKEPKRNNKREDR
jgi:hypothetical protein